VRVIRCAATPWIPVPLNYVNTVRTISRALRVIPACAFDTNKYAHPL
jgi:hypothetical protein